MKFSQTDLPSGKNLVVGKNLISKFVDKLVKAEIHLKESKNPDA